MQVVFILTLNVYIMLLILRIICLISVTRARQEAYRQAKVTRLRIECAIDDLDRDLPPASKDSPVLSGREVRQTYPYRGTWGFAERKTVSCAARYQIPPLKEGRRMTQQELSMR
jgi:hypothetical protein